jgi:hypothetical protein
MKSRIAQKIQEQRDAGHNFHEDRHYTPAEIAEQWHLSVHTVRRMFEKLDGVVKVGRQAQGDGKRRYMKLRIPKTVVQAVYEELIGPI